MYPTNHGIDGFLRNKKDGKGSSNRRIVVGIIELILHDRFTFPIRSLSPLLPAPIRLFSLSLAAG